MSLAAQGSELFTNYGKRWFKDRRIQRSHPPRNASVTHSLEELERNGQCLTNLHVAESPLPFAGKGVFASKAFMAGEVVTISPVLVLPRHALELEAEYSVLINYCITSPDIMSIYTPRRNDSSADVDAAAAASEGEGERGEPRDVLSDVALLPLSLAGMMNHGAGNSANVAMDW